MYLYNSQCDIATYSYEIFKPIALFLLCKRLLNFDATFVNAEIPLIINQ